MKHLFVISFMTLNLLITPTAVGENIGHSDAHSHQDVSANESDSSHDVHHHQSHSVHPVEGESDATEPDGQATLTRTDEIDRALAAGGAPIVADVLGVVCDFCAIAMNKIFGDQPEVAAVYVDLDTKALSLVLSPSSSLSDAAIADLAVQAGYRIAAIRRDEAALGVAL
ncbi:hypothetical protein N9M28_06360 [Luminiphilus sp.]|nr:hypothetical protein [Luminiphilus sp.]MDA9798026.1 hypothetical protein [Luminiphilus sp.]